jgi:hypothetical protein
MARAYYSTTFDLPAEQVWDTVRDFGVYEWAEGVSETHMENGRPGDTVGGIRGFRYAGNTMRQRLLAHSDLDRSYTFSLCDPSPMQNYQATLRVTPITDGNRTFIEWWASFDCDPTEANQWIAFLETEGFPVWLGSIPAHITKRGQ